MNAWNYKLRMHPPPPKAMEERGITVGVVLVARLKASHSARGWMLRRFRSSA